MWFLSVEFSLGTRYETLVGELSHDIEAQVSYTAHDYRQWSHVIEKHWGPGSLEQYQRSLCRNGLGWGLGR